MTRAEKIFLERCNHELGVLIEWCASPNVTPMIQDCIDILCKAKTDIYIRSLDEENDD